MSDSFAIPYRKIVTIPAEETVVRDDVLIVAV